MKAKDYRRLARLSLKNRKKTTLQTVLGIAFGLVLLFPLLFIGIGFYGGFNIAVNQNPSFRTFFINYGQMKDNDTNVSTVNLEYQQNIESMSGISNIIDFNYITIKNDGYHPSYRIDQGNYIELKGNASRTHRGYGITIIDSKNASSPFLKGDYTYTKKPLYAGSVFSEGSASKGEIMVSTTFLRDLELKAESLIGHTLSLRSYAYPTSPYLASDSEETISQGSYLYNHELVPLFNNYKIVGVYDSDIYTKSSIRYRSLFYDNDSLKSVSPYNREYFWITSASLGNDGVEIAPRKIAKEISNPDGSNYNGYWYYYENAPVILAEDITRQGYCFFPYALGVELKTNYSPNYAHKSSYIEFNNFLNAKNAFDNIDSFYEDSSTFEGEKTINAEISLPGFKQYINFFDIFLYICIALLALGGVIFIATLLNLLNTLHFSVESSKGFLGICRAIGLRNKGVIRLFLNQVQYIFLYAYLPVVIIGGGACVGVKLIFDKIIKDSIKTTTSLTFTIEWWYIPIAFVVLFIITTLISILFSHLTASKVSKTPILNILSEENK
ncbi:MAG: hypothetical protein K5906_03940 [Bacilli bacterium]|nr:hypothetical protein [Bacilli bacterium]